MPNRWSGTGGGSGRTWWAVPAAVLLAVLVPTACVLWFMTEAMRNEHLAVRQELADICRDRALSARRALEAYWAQKASALADAEGLPAAEAFAALVRSGVADGAIVSGASGGAGYPAPVPVGTDPVEDTAPWREAVRLEHDLASPQEAARAYAAIAGSSDGADVRARALQAQARCLLRAGRKREALEVLTGPLAEGACRGARDRQGRLIQPSALLLAVELTADRAAAAAMGQDLARRLADYGPPVMPSAQRRFLMQALRRTDPAVSFDTLAAEELAAEVLEQGPRRSRPLRLSQANAAGVWQFASRGGRTIALYRGRALAAVLEAAAELGRTVAGMRIHLAPPDDPGGGVESLVSVAAAAELPGWKLEARPAEQGAFAAAAGRQTAAYLWTGMLGIAIIAVLGVMAGGYVARQMRLARLKNDLIATVSHELKTPLASMRVLVDTLLAGRCRDQAQAGEYLGLIAKENERLSRLIDNFLTFSRMERNRRAFEFGEVRVEEVAATAEASVRDRFSQSGCRLEVDVAPGLPAIRGDRDALVTVLLNLLDNAQKYSGGEKQVALRACADDAAVCLEVADNGLGLSRRAARRIFDRFYQVDRSLSRAAGGCGLGLSIVKFIVDAHGGSVEVASQPGKGSTFTVKLPIPRREAQDEQ